MILKLENTWTLADFFQVTKKLHKTENEKKPRQYSQINTYVLPSVALTSL